MLGDAGASLLGMAASAVLIIVLAYWFTRYVVGRGALGPRLGGRNAGQMEVLVQLALGREERLVLVRVGERYLLLGVTAGSISALAELTKEDAALWQEKQDGPSGQTPTFGEAFRQILHQRGRR